MALLLFAENALLQETLLCPHSCSG